MPNIELDIANRQYLISCAEGEEEQVYALANIVNNAALQAKDMVSGLTETRTFLIASLLLAEQIDSNAKAAENHKKSDEEKRKILEAEKLKIEEELTSNYERAITMAASSVAELALRMENLAETLEQLAKDT